MTDQPQRLRDEQEQDIIDQIMSKSPAYSHPEEADRPEVDEGASTQPIPDAPADPVPEEKAPTEGRPQNKRSSVYIYLLILFGAAFLMLLLAYFVQQRNSETTISDLRDSMTLSRTELLEQIETLKEENESLQQDNEQLSRQLDQLEMERDDLQTRIDALYYLADETRARAVLNNLLDCLERFNDARDWLMSGTLVEHYDNLFNEHNPEFMDTGLLASQAARYLELREEVFDKGRCMMLTRHYATEDQSEYTERPNIAEAAFDVSDLSTAGALLRALQFYPNDPETTAYHLATLLPMGDVSLSSGAFKQSTIELFEQVKADLVDKSLLTENEDGTVSLSALSAASPHFWAIVSRETPDLPPSDEAD